MTIFVDLDGVLADFESYIADKVGRDGWKAELKKPNWGVIGNFQDLYSCLDPKDDALVLWDYLRNNFDDVQILTTIPKRAHFPDAVNHKREWVYRHFGSNVKVNFGPYAQDKQYHCHPPFCMPKDILIDDMNINCRRWRERGGLAIEHKNAQDTIEKLETFRSNY